MNKVLFYYYYYYYYFIYLFIYLFIYVFDNDVFFLPQKIVTAHWEWKMN